MLYEMTVPNFTKMLRNLSHVLAMGAENAQARKFEPAVLLNSRLAPDQFNLIRQVQIATDTAKLCCARMTGKEAHSDEDKEQTMEDLKARIDRVLNYLNTLTAADFKGTEEKNITQPRWEGKWLTGQDYVMQHAIPNFYFHVTTAYAILRHNGVPVGKKDYLGEMPYRH